MEIKQNINSFSGLSKVLLITLIFFIYLFPVTGQNCFVPGEKLRYSIYFGPINAGVADVNLVKTYHNNKEVFYSKLIGRSAGLPDKIYKVYDTYESYFDSISILPVMSIRDIREGRYRKKNIDTYYHQTNIVFCGNKGEIQTPPDIRDAMSAFYSFRNYSFSSLKKGNIIKIDIFFDDELMTFILHYMGKEHIKTRTGEFNCLKFIPEIAEVKKNENTENISPTPADDMILWISDDPNHIPIRVRFDLFIGSIKCDLIGYSGLKY
jgi:hypothetical protein